MSKEDNLDLSKISVSALLDDQPTPAAESTEETPETTEAVETETPTTDETVEETTEETSEEIQEDDTEAEAPNDNLQEAADALESETETEEEEATIISTLKERMGYDIEGEFADDYDGIANLTKAMAEKIAEEQFQSVFQSFPDIQEYLNYRVSGGDPDKFFKVAAKEIDFGKLQLNKDDKGMQRKVVESFMQMQGFEPEEISEAIQDYEDAGLLLKNSERAVKKLAAHQVKEKESLVKQQQQQAQETARQTQETWGQIGSIINKGRLRDFTIPESDKKRFYSWMATPVDNQGRSQRLIDREKLDQESILAMEYLMYKGLDISKLVSAKVNTKQAASLKAKLKSSKPTASRRMKGNKGGYNKSSNGRPNIPTLDKLLG
jgi:DNA-binding transcriptional MerR regulator